jgi:hypothetical protein
LPERNEYQKCVTFERLKKKNRKQTKPNEKTTKKYKKKIVSLQRHAYFLKPLLDILNYSFFYSFIHMCIHCLGHFTLLPPTPTLPSLPPSLPLPPTPPHF